MITKQDTDLTSKEKYQLISLIKRNVPLINKGKIKCDNPAAEVIVNGEKLKAFPL
jgi:hypothetical protein